MIIVIVDILSEKALQNFLSKTENKKVPIIAKRFQKKEKHKWAYLNRAWSDAQDQLYLAAKFW